METSTEEIERAVTLYRKLKESGKRYGGMRYAGKSPRDRQKITAFPTFMRLKKFGGVAYAVNWTVNKFGYTDAKQLFDLWHITEAIDMLKSHPARPGKW